MNNKVKEIVSILLKAEELNTLKDAQQISNYFSVLYALCLNNPGACNHDNLEAGLKDTDIIDKDFRQMHADFKTVSGRLPKGVKNNIFGCIKDITGDAGDNDVSWADEYIKASLATCVQKKRNKETKCKISGGNLLLTTQFFTDDYMVEYIVDSVFEQLKDSIPDVVFVDPACGGGNFLTHVSKKLFNWYKKNTSLSVPQIVNKIYGEQIVGYDLDSNIAAIAKLSLMLQRDRFCGGITAMPTILGGRETDTLGYLTDDINENVVKKEIDSRRRKGKTIAFVTNPPFMGGRDLDPMVKSYLDAKLPLGMGDLCVSFMCRMMTELADGDIIGSVLQNSWLFLSSYKGLRSEFLDHYDLIKCADLGAHAFADIGGEKANVVLAIITKKSHPTVITQFINLRNRDYESKQAGLRGKNVDAVDVDCQSFRDVPDCAFNYELIGVFRTKPKSIYGDFSHIMQGTSTGDSKNAVKFFWEVPNDNNDWTLVSKGGGFCKWCGLSYYKVLWGKNGEALRNNSGCALRNISEIPSTQLVYSDTGTMGLNVRQKRMNQVFIASGPGIHAIKGYPECHQAFLNSKFATYWLKVSSPKLTVSAGYIAKIPVTKSLLYSKQLKTFAEQCISSKYHLLESKLPNVECHLQDFSVIDNVEKHIESVILSDLANYYNIIKAESEIDRIIYRSLHLRRDVVKAIDNFSGENISGASLSPEVVDLTLFELLDINCQVVGAKKSGAEVGSDNLIGLACSKLGCDPKTLYEFCVSNIAQMKVLKQKYLYDFRHKVFLQANGVTSLRDVIPSSVILGVAKMMKKVCPAIGTISAKEISEIYNHHVKAFYNTPFLSL